MKHYIKSTLACIILSSYLIGSNTQSIDTIGKSDLEAIKKEMLNEIENLTEQKLNFAVKIIWELYEYLNKHNLDLNEEDFWNLLYEYLEWDLTIKKLEEDFSIPKELLPDISEKLLFGQEINSKKLERELEHSKQVAIIEWIALEIQQKDSIIEEENRKQEVMKKIIKTSNSIWEKFWN